MSRTALITGASSGLGFEFSKILAREHYNLILIARNKKKLFQMKKSIQSKYNVNVTVIPKDLSKKDAALEVYNEVIEKNIDVDILINNAGFGDFGRFVDCDWNKQYEMLQVNIMALIQMTKLFMKPMIKKGSGKILNMASTAAFQSGPFFSNYFASKAYVLSFTEAIVMELKGTGVSAMALCPGPTRTGFKDRADANNSNLFNNFKVATAKEVAEYGYQKLMKGKIVAIHGRRNKLLVIGTKITPRFIIRNIMYYLQRVH